MTSRTSVTWPMLVSNTWRTRVSSTLKSKLLTNTVRSYLDLSTPVCCWLEISGANGLGPISDATCGLFCANRCAGKEGMANSAGFLSTGEGSFCWYLVFFAGAKIDGSGYMYVVILNHSRTNYRFLLHEWSRSVFRFVFLSSYCDFGKWGFDLPSFSGPNRLWACLVAWI